MAGLQGVQRDWAPCTGAERWPWLLPPPCSLALWWGLGWAPPVLLLSGKAAPQALAGGSGRQAGPLVGPVCRSRALGL